MLFGIDNWLRDRSAVRRLQPAPRRLLADGRADASTRVASDHALRSQRHHDARSRRRPSGSGRLPLCRPDQSHDPREPASAAVPRRDRGRVLRPRLLLGCRAAVLGDRRRLRDRGRLPERLHSVPDLRRGLLGPDRPRRGRAGRLRPGTVSYERLLQVFFTEHDPTQGMRQGNDVGTQYRSGIYYADQRQKADRRARPGRLPAGARSARSRE